MREPGTLPTPEMLSRLWLRMQACYGHRWASSYGTLPVDDDGRLTLTGDTWAQGLAGFGEAQLRTGLRACITSADPWPPTLPEFRALCLAIPPLADVRAELARPPERRSPFASLVLRHLDRYRWRTVDAAQGERLVREAYAAARSHLLEGGEMPPPAAALPEPEPGTPAREETAQAALDAIRRHLGTPETPEDTDPQNRGNPMHHDVPAPAAPPESRP